MRVVIQRVKQASVAVNGRTVSSIGPGLVCLIGLQKTDSANDSDIITKKILHSKIFADPSSGANWKRSVVDVAGEVLCVSQFTLYGRVKGSKPDFTNAMPPTEAKEAYHDFLQRLRDAYQQDRVSDGEFGAMMDVSLVNDGPVTLTVDSDGSVGITS